MNDSDKPVVLVTAVGAPPGLNALRALHESGRYRLVAADADRLSPALYQYGFPHAVLPLATRGTEAYLSTLTALIKEHAVEVLVPCIEEEVGLIAHHREAIEAAGARVLLPDGATVARAASKHLATETARKHGIACPETILIVASASADERSAAVEEFAARCAAPWICKPVIGHGMRGVVTVESLDQLRTHLATAKGDQLLQEKIPGAIGSMHLVGLVYDATGKVTRRFSSRSIRTLYPDGGPATGGISLHHEQLVASTIALVDSLGTWRGPMNAEWMLDPRDGQFKFIEINPRLWGYGYLATGSGTNFPVATVELALGRDIGPDAGFRAGVVMLRTSHDLIFSECPFPLES